MKIVFSYICLVLVVLNVMGYYGVLVSLQSHHARAFSATVRKGEYKETFRVKVPVKSARQQEEFQEVDSTFEEKGQLYRLIRQRIYMDTFHIVYIKDIRGTAINLALKDYVDSFASQPSDNHQDGAFILPLFMKEYWVRTFTLQRGSDGWDVPVAFHTNARSFIPSFFPDIVHPPERFKLS